MSASAVRSHIPWVTEIELINRDAAIDWIINNQLGRRNLTFQQICYYRGLQYDREKAKVTKNQYTSAGAKSLPQQKTSEKLASQHKVSQQTIKNDAQFARAVDNVAKAAGNSAKSDLLSRDAKVTKQDTVKLGEIAQSNPETICLWHVQLFMQVKIELVQISFV